MSTGIASSDYAFRREEVTAEKANFAFAAAAVVVPYEPASNPTETRLYHLYSLAWFFPSTVAGTRANQARFRASHRPGKRAELEKLIREISNDLRTISG